jgi:hypothetical protein
MYSMCWSGFSGAGNLTRKRNARVNAPVVFAAEVQSGRPLEKQMNLQSTNHDLYVHSYLGYQASIYVLWESCTDSPTGMLVEVGRPGSVSRTLRVSRAFSSSTEAILEGKVMAEQYVQSQAGRA